MDVEVVCITKDTRRRLVHIHTLDALVISVELGTCAEFHRRKVEERINTHFDIGTKSYLVERYAIHICSAEEQPQQLLSVVDKEVVAINHCWSLRIGCIVDCQLIILAIERSQHILGTLLEGYRLELANNARLNSRSTRSVKLHCHLLAVGQAQHCRAEAKIATRENYEKLLTLGRKFQTLTERVIQCIRCAIQGCELAIRKVNLECTCNSTALGSDSHTCESSFIVRASQSETQNTTQVVQLNTLIAICHLTIHRSRSILESALLVVLLRREHNIRTVVSSCREGLRTSNNRNTLQKEIVHRVEDVIRIVQYHILEIKTSTTWVCFINNRIIRDIAVNPNLVALAPIQRIDTIVTLVAK